MIWKKLLGLLVVTVFGVILELIYLYLSRTGSAPSYRFQLKPNIDLL